MYALDVITIGGTESAIEAQNQTALKILSALSVTTFFSDTEGDL